MKLENGDAIKFYRTWVNYPNRGKPGIGEINEFHHIELSSETDVGEKNRFYTEGVRGNDISSLFSLLVVLGVSKQAEYLYATKTSDEQRALMWKAMCEMSNYHAQIRCNDDNLQLEIITGKDASILNSFLDFQIKSATEPGFVHAILDGDDCVDRFINAVMTLEREKMNNEEAE